ncbi:MAG: response regulator [Lachnospiraceae bacterium]|nr:response regulator [Lachnospiraceae bacterium]
MDKRILLIGDTKSFMVNGIINGLEREGYEVRAVQPDLNVISHVEDEPHIWVLFLDGIPVGIQKTLHYIRDRIGEKEHVFFPIGNREELEQISQLIPEHLFTKSFLRPLNVKDLATELDMAVYLESQTDGKKRILIVDDDPTMLKMMKNLLGTKYRVFLAGSGMNAISLLSKESVDLVLLDYEMPVISGAKVLEMMRSEAATSEIPVMFLTGKNDRASVMSTVPLHPEKYLLKSMPPEEWLESIEEFFVKKKQQKL